MSSNQDHSSDSQVGSYRHGSSVFYLMKCGACAGLFLENARWRADLREEHWVSVCVDPALPIQPLSEFEKANETSVARKLKEADRHGRLCSCRGAGPMRGLGATEVDFPRDYVVEELVDLIKSQR